MVVTTTGGLGLCSGMSGKRRVGRLEQAALRASAGGRSSDSRIPLYDENEVLREKLAEAVALIEQLVPQSMPSLADQAEAERERLENIWRKRPLAEIAEAMTAGDFLFTEAEFLWAIAPAYMQHTQLLSQSQHEKRIIASADREEAKRVIFRRQDRQGHAQIALACASSSIKVKTLLTTARSIALTYLHASDSVLDGLRRERLIYAESWLQKLRGCWADYVPRTPYTPSSVLIWLNTDNLDIYSRKSMTRVKEGTRVKSALLHALVTERIFFDPNLLTGPEPNGSLWNLSDPEAFKLHVVPKFDATQKWLAGLHHKYLELAMISILEPMKRPTPEKDHHRTGPTITQSMPILTDHSTSTSADLAAYMHQVEEWFGKDAYFIHLGDFMTFRNIWFNIFRMRPVWNHHTVQGDEFHLQTHHNHASKILWYQHVVKPAALMLYRTDVRVSYEAARFNSQESFMRMLACAVLRYLIEIPLSSELRKHPWRLMEHVKKNLGLWEMLGWYFYYGVFALENKNAMRIGDSAELDKAWMYTTLLSRPAGKKNYAKYGLMMQIVLCDTHPWVRQVIKNERTFRETEIPCTGRGKGVIIERVRQECIKNVSHVLTMVLLVVRLCTTTRKGALAQQMRG